MKKLLLLFTVPALVVLATGCLKHKDEDVTPVTPPQGTFTGVFTRIHYNTTTQKKDTTKINLQISFNGSNFEVTGDTTKHAGSIGTFQYDSIYLQFNDTTVPANTTNVLNLPKYHTVGLYKYAYSGDKLEFQAYNDTLLHDYTLTKTN